MRTCRILDSNPAVEPLAEGIEHVNGSVSVVDANGTVHIYPSMVWFLASTSHYGPGAHVYWSDGSDSRKGSLGRQDIDSIAHGVATELVRDLSAGWKARWPDSQSDQS